MRELKILTFCSSRSHGRTHTYTPRTIQTETPGTSFTLLNQTRAAAYSSTRRELRRVAGQPHGWKRTSAHWSSRYSRYQGEGGVDGENSTQAATSLTIVLGYNERPEGDNEVAGMAAL